MHFITIYSWAILTLTAVRVFLRIILDMANNSYKTIRNVKRLGGSQSWWWDEEVIIVKSQTEQEVIKDVLKPTTVSVYSLSFVDFRCSQWIALVNSRK